MIRLPAFQHLSVQGYGMFPGTPSKPGLEISLEPGLTLVLGTNGLGKTTLVTLLYRMCTGPSEIPGLAGTPVLGSRSLTALRLRRNERRVLASRVVDDAADATATLRLSFGGEALEVTRRLADLTLTRLSYRDEDLQATEDSFHERIVDLCGVSTFGEWILVLRYLTFYFEDRRALVWDATAQRQMLRLLLLDKDTSAAWAAKERDVLELDSRVRNLQATLTREEGVERRARTLQATSESVLTEVARLESTIRAEAAALEALNSHLPDADAARQHARLRALTTAQERDSLLRDLERLQLTRIRSAFPSHDETATYLLSRLLSTDVCQVCGHNVPSFRASLEARIRESECVVCGSGLTGSQRMPRGLQSQLTQTSSLYAAVSAAAVAAAQEATAADKEFDSIVARHRKLEDTLSTLRARVAGLLRQLPPSEREIHAQTAEVGALQARLEGLKSHLTEKRSAFEASIRADMQSISSQRGTIIETFHRFAEGFLFDEASLNWAPHKARVGQTGPSVEFPAFEFAMMGSDFPTPVRRTGPEQVSESQREFVDLAFRMTLMTVAGGGTSGTLIIDAPEASLDAVFSARAAEVLTRFAGAATGNRLIVTSNLVEGQLIPEMARLAGIHSPRSPRVVDLLRLAAPTTATRELAVEYRAVKERIFSKGSSAR